MINFYQWRTTCWIVCLIVVIRFAWKYQSRAEIHHEQLSRITETLHQTEANFSRISRELKRQRSKSRSRSRSIRSRRAKQLEERTISPRNDDKKKFNVSIFITFDLFLVVVSPQRPLKIRDENKENFSQMKISVAQNLLIDDEEDEDETSNVIHQKTKPQYSRIFNRFVFFCFSFEFRRENFRSSKSTRILIGRNNFQNQI